ncbi:MAG: hypothetical protein J6C50_00555 [Rickettsiales bacterium]|nr:hypothetical protein [Rickettsiales bacterium]
MYSSNNLIINQANLGLIDGTRAPDCIVFITDPDNWYSIPFGYKSFRIRNDGVTYLVEYDKYFEHKTVLEESRLSKDDFNIIKRIYEEHVRKYGRVWEK